MSKKFAFGTLNMIIKIVVIVCAIYLLIYVGKFAFKTGYEMMTKSPTADEEVVDVQIEIPEGSSTESIAKILKDNKLISNILYFRVLSKISGNDGNFQYGKYTLSTSMDEEAIMNILLTEGEQRNTVKFTIPEGYTIKQIAAKLEADGLCTAQDFIDVIVAANFDYKFIEQIPERALGYKLEGYLFPSTYEIFENATAQDIANKMLKQFDTVFAEEYYTRAAALGMNLDQIVTIASMIEKEVRYPDERSTVSGVIYNRLGIDMILQIDATVLFAWDVLGQPITTGVVLYSDLEIDSPYNTYLYTGLPIGPIANPGKSTLEAALYPEEHDYLYYVVMDPETGQHEFNTNLDDHNNSVNKYKQ